MTLGSSCLTLLEDGVEDHVTTGEQQRILPKVHAALSEIPSNHRIGPGVAQLD